MAYLFCTQIVQFIATFFFCSLFYQPSVIILIMNATTSVGILLILIVLSYSSPTNYLPQCASNCSIGCKRCDNVTCTECLQGYQWSAQNMTCQLNECQIDGCALCDGNGSCIRCQSQYAVFDHSVARCIEKCGLENCSKCKRQSSNCDICQPGFSLYSWNNQCIQSTIPYCIRVHDWRGKDFICEICKHEYRPSTDRLRCIPDKCRSIQGCLRCQNRSICEQCLAGFRLEDGTCLSNVCQVKECLFCSVGKVCLQCKPSFDLISNQCIPQPCLLPNCQKCKSGSIFCDRCSNSSTYNIWSKQCQIVQQTPKPQNCLIMSKIDRLFKCLQCREHFRSVDKNQVKCIRNCSQGCLNCEEQRCLQCLKGFKLVNNSCDRIECPDGMIGCQLCSQNKSCLQCSDPFSLFNPQSQSCHLSCHLANCLLCYQSSTTCLECQQGYTLYQWKKECIFSTIPHCKISHDWKHQDFRCSKCQQGYKPTQDNQECIFNGCPQISDCQYCFNVSQCLKCRTGYTFINGSCQPNQCHVENCLACNLEGICLRSDSKFFISAGQMVAVACAIENCVSCRPGSIYCQQCSDGYQTDSNGSCVLLSTEDTAGGTGKRYIWLIVVFVIALVLVIAVIKFIKWVTTPQFKQPPPRSEEGQRNDAIRILTSPAILRTLNLDDLKIEGIIESRSYNSEKSDQKKEDSLKSEKRQERQIWGQKRRQKDDELSESVQNHRRLPKLSKISRKQISQESSICESNDRMTLNNISKISLNSSQVANTDRQSEQIESEPQARRPI